MPENQTYMLSYPGEDIDSLLRKIDVLGPATPQTAGLMSATDKQKLDNIDPDPVEKVPYAKLAGGVLAVLGEAVGFSPIALRWTGPSGAALVRELRGETILNVDEIQGRTGSTLLSTGINLWDGAIESGDYNDAGEPVDDDEKMRSVNPVYVAGGQTYKFLGANANVVEFAIDGSVIESYGVDKGEEFEVEAGSDYLLFSVDKGDEDVCICFADSATAGFHAPKQSSIDLKPFIWTSGGERIFPEGMDGNGVVYDKALVDPDGMIRTAVVAMGRRDHEAGDEDDPSVVTDGTTTAYPLEVPRTVSLDTPVLATFEVVNGGLIYAFPDIVDGELYPSLKMLVSFPEAPATPDSQMSDTSTNAVQNKVIKEYVDEGLAEKVPAEGVAPNLIAGGSVSEFGDSASERFLYKQTEGGSGHAWLRSIRGRTVSYNQLSEAAATHTQNDVTVTKNDDGTVTVSGTATSTGSLASHNQINTIDGHKYYIALNQAAIDAGLTIFTSIGGNISIVAAIRTATQSGVANVSLRSDAAITYDNVKAYIKTVDLTQAGLDSIITTPEQFEEWQMEQFGHNGYLGYTPGKLVSVNPTGVKTTTPGGDEHTLPLDFTEHFPTGMNGVNGIYDEVVSDENGKFTDGDKRFGKVDLGTLNWVWAGTASATVYSRGTWFSQQKMVCSRYPSNDIYPVTGILRLRDESIVQTDIVNGKIAKLSGIPLVFELATLQHVTFTDPADATYPVTEGGTEQVLPVNGSEPTTIAPDFQISRGAGYMKKADVVQEQGSGTDKVMSQKAVTDALDEKAATDGIFPLFRAGFAEAIVDTDSAGTEQKFTNRISGGDGAAFYRKVKGNTLMWNQLVQNGDFSDGATGWTGVGGTVTAANNVGTFTAGASVVDTSRIQCSLPTIAGHKYRVRVVMQGSISESLRVKFSNSPQIELAYTAGVKTTAEGIITEGGTASSMLYVYPNNGGTMVQGDTCNFYSIEVTDITQAGLDSITTPAEFEALFPLPYYAYNPGSPIHNRVQTVQTTGRNQWDEEWEVGALNTDTGLPAPDSGCIRSKNFIPLVGGRYYAKANSNLRFIFYDDAKNFLSSSIPSSETTNAAFDLPVGAVFAKFYSRVSPTTYNHDICINLSDEAINGTYFPYQVPRQLDVDVATRKASDDSVPFPNGTRSAEAAADWYDENGGAIVMDEIDLGSLTWSYSSGRFSASIANVKGAASSSTKANAACSRLMLATADQTADSSYDKIFALTSTGILVRHSGYTDAGTFKTAMSGVKLVFETSSPTTFTWKERMPLMIKVSKYGTEKMLPENTSVPASAPFRADTTYSISVAELVRILSNL